MEIYATGRPKTMQVSVKVSCLLLNWLTLDILVDGAVPDVRITSAAIIPRFHPDALIDVYHAEQAIEALGTVGDILQARHTGLIFCVLDNKKEFTVEWYTGNFPFGAILPSIRPLPLDNETAETSNSSRKLGLEWENEAYAWYNPSNKRDRWTRGRTLVGTITGAILSNWSQWVVRYQESNPGYQLFEVWDRPYLVPGRTKRFIPSTICSTFTEDSLRELYRLGGKRGFKTGRTILRRTYLPLISRTQPRRVDLADAKESAAVRDFYVRLSRAIKRGSGEGKEGDEGDGGGRLSTSDFIRLLADQLEVFYVYNLPRDEYMRVELVPPYVALTQMYQPMSLPWQKFYIDGDSILRDPGEFANSSNSENCNDGEYMEEFSYAAEALGNLLKRRLPKMLGQKVKQLRKTAFVTIGLVLAIMRLTLSVPSFMSGLMLGVFLGALVPQISFFSRSVE